MADYELIKVHASYSFSARGKISARIENALDDDYETALGFGTPGLSLIHI